MPKNQRKKLAMYFDIYHPKFSFASLVTFAGVETIAFAFSTYDYGDECSVCEYEDINTKTQK